MLPEDLDIETHKKALAYGKLAAKTYDFDDNVVVSIGMAFFRGIDDIKQQDFSTPNYKRVGKGGNFVDFLGGGDAGLDYTLFQEKNTGSICLAFRGTEPLSIEDWKDDIHQAVSGFVNGTSKQYDAAIRLAMDLSAKLEEKGTQLSFTGHSLGGGLATAAALATGREAIVFDAAGVSSGTIAHIKQEYYKLNKKDVKLDANASKVINFNVRGCFVSDPNTPLGRIQDAVDTKQYGRVYWLKSISERADFIGLPDFLTTVKMFESILNHAWHVYTYQMQRKNYEEPEVVLSTEIPERPKKKQKTDTPKVSPEKI